MFVIPSFTDGGMHMIPRGWVYNVSGRSAVEVNLKDGTRLRLGTDEIDRRGVDEELLSLASALQQPPRVRALSFASL